MSDGLAACSHVLPVFIRGSIGLMGAMRWPFFAAAVILVAVVIGVQTGQVAPWSWVIGWFGAIIGIIKAILLLKKI